MSLIESYLITTKNLNPVIDAVVNAQAPDKFTIAFLEQLGFKSTNDRLYLKLFFKEKRQEMYLNGWLKLLRN
ncbi:MAG: DUF5343 domain-containing protein [Cyclobacteriaceae bacterium]